MGQWLIDVGADKALGVLIIVLSIYFGLKMFLSSRDPREDIAPEKRFTADDPTIKANEVYIGGEKSRKSRKTPKY